jgi:oxalate decarboxylase/phosphoglucose isomerase-like protein (cupin superfamily)
MTKKFSLLNSAPETFPGGEMKRANKKTFEALKGFALQSITLQPGGKREAHTHPNAAQMDYVVSGKARIGIIGQGTDVEIHDVSVGDVTFIPTGYFHWIENTSKEPVHFLLVLNHEDPQTIEFRDVAKVLNDEAAVSTNVKVVAT